MHISEMKMLQRPSKTRKHGRLATCTKKCRVIIAGIGVEETAKDGPEKNSNDILVDLTNLIY